MISLSEASFFSPDLIFCLLLSSSIIAYFLFLFRAARYLFFITCFAGIIFGFIHWTGALSLVFISSCIYLYYTHKKDPWQSFLLAGIISIGIGVPIYCVKVTR